MATTAKAKKRVADRNAKKAADKKSTTTKKTTSSSSSKKEEPKKSTSTKNTSSSSSSKVIGQYKGVDIKSGSDKDISDQMKAIDKKSSSSKKEEPKKTETKTTTPPKTSSSSYTGGSVVDYLSSSGQASDFSSRSKLAAQNGISGYTGTAEQNTQLLNKLRSSSSINTSIPSLPIGPSAGATVSSPTERIETDSKGVSWKVTSTTDSKGNITTKRERVNSNTPVASSNLDVIYDSATRQYFSRDSSIPGSTYKPYTPAGISPETLAGIDDTVETGIEGVISSGGQINPGLTEEDLKAIDPKNFLKEAEGRISAEYKGKFAQAKDKLLRDLSNYTDDLSRYTDDVNYTANRSISSGQEDLASRGLAFGSSQRKLYSDVDQYKQKAIEEKNIELQRSGQSALESAESQIGTDEVKNLGIGKIGNRSLSFNSKPLIGSLTSEKTYTAEMIAKQLAQDEAQKRGYITRSLSFS